jgi:hypothetical protein
MIIKFIKDFKKPLTGKLIKKGKQVECTSEFGNDKIKQGYAEKVENETSFSDALFKKITKAEEKE